VEKTLAFLVGSIIADIVVEYIVILVATISWF